MPRTRIATILRHLRTLVVGLLLLVAAALILTWVSGLVTWATMTVELPNGAVVARAFDWKLHPRADLYASHDGPLLVRDIDMICWDERNIDGHSVRGAVFFWTKGSDRVVRGDDPDYLPKVRASELCQQPASRSGQSPGYVAGELILLKPEYVRYPPPP